MEIYSYNAQSHIINHDTESNIHLSEANRTYLSPEVTRWPYLKAKLTEFVGFLNNQHCSM